MGLSVYSFVICECFGNVYYHFSASLTEVFLCFFLSCKANAGVKLAKMSTARTLPNYLLFVLFCCYLCCSMHCLYLCCSMYCSCVNVYCTTATEC